MRKKDNKHTIIFVWDKRPNLNPKPNFKLNSKPNLKFFFTLY